MSYVVLEMFTALGLDLPHVDICLPIKHTFVACFISLRHKYSKVNMCNLCLRFASLILLWELIWHLLVKIPSFWLWFLQSLLIFCSWVLGFPFLWAVTFTWN